MDIDKIKMEELLGLLEELVINKVRIEKIQNEIKDSQYKKILGTEVQVVSKVQEVIKNIQTTTIKSIYMKLKDLFDPNAKIFEFNGDTSKFDYFNEEQIHLLLKILTEHILGTYGKAVNKKIIISASNDSTNLVIQVKYTMEHISFSNLIQKFDKKYIPLTQIPENEIHAWLSETGLSNSIKDFGKLYETAKSFNTNIEIREDGTQDLRVIITVPVSTSIVNAQLVQINNSTYAIPAEYIEKVMNTNLAQMRKSNNRLFISYMDKIIPIIGIDEELKFENNEEYSGYVILAYKDKMKAMPVHLLLDQLDIVVKSKPNIINDVREFKGITILGDGNAIMVFDIPYLIESTS